MGSIGVQATRWLRPSSETLDRPTAPTGQNRLRETRLQPGRRMGHHHRAAPTEPQAARRRIQAGPHGQDGRAARELIERQRQGAWVASAQGREVMKRVARHPGLSRYRTKPAWGPSNRLFQVASTALGCGLAATAHKSSSKAGGSRPKAGTLSLCSSARDISSGEVLTSARLRSPSGPGREPANGQIQARGLPRQDLRS